MRIYTNCVSSQHVYWNHKFAYNLINYPRYSNWSELLVLSNEPQKLSASMKLNFKLLY